MARTPTSVLVAVAVGVVVSVVVCVSLYVCVQVHLCRLTKILFIPNQITRVIERTNERVGRIVRLRACAQIAHNNAEPICELCLFLLAVSAIVCGGKICMCVCVVRV